MMAWIFSFLILVLIVLTLPLLLVVSGLIVVFSGFPIFFYQKRVGKNGAVFTMYKFRTMVGNAEKAKRNYVSLNESVGPAFKIHNDPRFTPIGKILSHTGLDELPQLFNVLRGDMALIGPRPLPVSEAKKLKPWMHARQQIRPGIISPAYFKRELSQRLYGVDAK